MDVERIPVTTKWTQIYQRKENMDSVVISNRSGVRLHYAASETEQKEKYRTLDPGDWVEIDTDLEYLYAQTETGEATLEVTTHFYSEKRMKQYQEYMKNLFSQIPRGFFR